MVMSRSCLVPVLLLVCGGSVLGQNALSPANGRPFVVVAGGAGGTWSLTENLRCIYSMGPLKCRRPVTLRIPWATEGENLRDYRDIQRHMNWGHKMAVEVQQIRRFAPDSPIVLIGYSAGCNVVLRAADLLPPNTVERIILLGPSVSANYDIRRSLAASKQGIDSFYCPGDAFMQDIEETIGAPGEPPGAKTAGCVGFRLASPCSLLARDPLMVKLRQHNVGWLENGHFGTVSPVFLAQRVAPLIPFSEIRPIGPAVPVVPTPAPSQPAQPKAP